MNGHKRDYIADMKMKEGHFLYTSESVCLGHPDKLCDYISDTILDACLEQDKDAKVACETCVKNNLCMVFGEINTNAKLNVEQLVRNAVKTVGYDHIDKGMDYKSMTVIVHLD
jgi:S-adenosylmethionine synthetase